jgi:glycoprotein 3-alpha-L-fucosyltransferase
VIVNSSGERTISLFPEESSGKDRITDQLMFLPPAVDIPDNQEDASLPLKKILMWNGVSSWGGVRPGRGEFIKQECPVSTCAIVTDMGEVDQEDMVLFKDHFNLPSFKRPHWQIWMIFMLGEHI